MLDEPLLGLEFQSMWGTTDELWFDEWEHQGLPWEKPSKYAEFSPHKLAREPEQIQNLDARDPQRSRLPLPDRPGPSSSRRYKVRASRMVNFPDERSLGAEAAKRQFWRKEHLRLVRKLPRRAK